MPLNRAPFRPAGVAKVPDFNSPSKRNLQSRISHTGGQKVIESRAGVKFNSGHSSHRQSANAEDDESEYEYGSEGSVEESDELDGDENDEQLQFDDENEYSPAKLNKQVKDNDSGIIEEKSKNLLSSPVKQNQSNQNVTLPNSKNPRNQGRQNSNEEKQVKSTNTNKNSIVSQPLNKLAIERMRKTTTNDWHESGEDEEEFSDGYLNGEEGGEEESPIRKTSNSPNLKRGSKQNAQSLQGSLPKLKEGRTSLQQ